VPHPFPRFLWKWVGSNVIRPYLINKIRFSMQSSHPRGFSHHLQRKFVLLSVLAALLVSASLTAAPLPDPLLRKPAPTFIRNDIAGHPIDLTSYRGHVILLTFWATWCAPCRVEMPRFIAWQNQYGPRGFQVIAISMDDDPAPVLALDRKLPFNFPVLMGDEDLGTLYGGILGLPIAYLIDRNGIVRARFKGNINLHSMELDVTKALRRP
jgi:thiol-disulfide isomerase/thioredoxin